MKNEPNQKFNLDKREILIFLIVGIMIFLLPLLFTTTWGAISFDKTGQIGDTIGGVTAPFLSFFGAILVYLALKAQIKANSLIQEQFEEQRQTDYRQNFENTFFNLLSIHHQIIENIDFETIRLIKGNDHLDHYFRNNIVYEDYYNEISEEIIHHSRDVFEFGNKFLHSLIEDDLIFKNHIPLKYYKSESELSKFNKLLEDIPNIEVEKILISDNIVDSRLNSIYKLVYGRFNADFGHYFRNLYRLIKLIDEKKFSEDFESDYEIKYSYTSIIRSQLSDGELGWLFFNCLSEYGSTKFKPLIEKYSLLKNLKKSDNVINFYKKLYSPSAFQKATIVK
ncbi:hypothetical protein KJK34_13020 [Flavobacterium sp. D11R37]|uniref:putative phage abortive infection protein n=1 Tax=Flavobacterium coralii TaxID=2838017 RepID=UPI001CA72E40|nr:putative phage abortive infection protein [Flavobacterium coralii]MBY8963677.1 hypothetical protein [Flavobacterium coralii]